jgi:6-phosphogluconolactonase
MTAVDTHPDPEAVAEAATLVFAQAASEAVSERGRFVVALAGGSTPRRLYELLAERMRDFIDWARVVIVFGDDRCVPPNHERSNYRLANETLLSKVPIAQNNVHRIMGDSGDPAAAARAYAQTLDDVLGDAPIDLVLLGMGADGHTASLFPGDTYPGGRTTAVHAPSTSPIAERVSLTYEEIARARQVVAMITGAGKAERVQQVLSGELDVPMTKVVKDRAGDVTFIVDEAAVS